MDIKSVSGVTCYVKNIDETISFYEKVGFEFKKKEKTRATMYVNWFWVDFIEEKEAIESKGAGIFIYMSVDNVDNCYQTLNTKGVKTLGEPYTTEAGNKEFIVQDPDGYNITFFKRLSNKTFNA